VSHREQRIVGIDFGTTNSVVAVVENGRPTVIPNQEGSTRTPSVVGFLPNGEIVVGEVARRQAAANPETTISSIKRLLGRSFAEVKEHGERFAFKILEKDDQVLIDVGGSSHRPEEIAAIIFSKLKGAAEDFLGDEVSKAVVTVPAYFDDLQRHATIEAARTAGLEVIRLINEPTAAAVAYGLAREDEEIVAVYDFGGGTFDFSLLDIEHSTIEVITSLGDSYLGGDDLDNAIVELLIYEFKEQHGVDIAADPVIVRRLKDIAEKAKCELSGLPTTTISVPFIAVKEGQPLHLERKINREEFEELIIEYVERTISCCQTALHDAKTAKRDIAKVILVGGSTRIPLVQDMVEEFFGLAPFKGVNPDEVVAMGAAAQAGIFEGHLQEVVLLDVSPHSLGVEVKNNRCSTIIEKNSTIPIKAAKTFTTTEDNQTFVVIHALQGESHNASDNISLGKFTLTEMKPAKAGTPRIRITFFINADSVLEISAEDLQSGKAEHLTIVHTFLSEDEHRARRSQRSTPRRRLPRPRIRAARKPIEELEPIGIAVASDEPSLSETPGGKDRIIESASFKEVRDETEHAETPPGVKKQPPAPPRAAPPPSDQVRTAVEVERPADMPAIIAEAEEFLKHDSSDGRALACYELAVPAYATFLEKYPSFIHLNLSLARMHMLRGLPSDAALWVDKFVSSKGANVSEAIDLLDHAIARFPDNAAIRRTRSKAHKILGEIMPAIDDLEYLLEQKTADDEAVDELERLYADRVSESSEPQMQFKLVKLFLKRNKLDEAIETLQILQARSSYRSRALKIMGLCYWQKNMLYHAWQKLRLLPLDEENKELLYRLGNDMEMVDQLPAAVDLYRKIRDADDQYKDIEAKLRKLEYRLKLKQEELEKTGVLAIFHDSRFEIVEEINRGSMGIIYRARDKVLDEVVALKVLNDYLSADSAAVERFKREARAAKKLSHPFIVRIHDLYELGDRKFLSMEYIEGTDVRTLIKNKVKFTEKQVLLYLMKMCDALEYAHGLNIVHRDIKPANIMITKENSIKITDFGIAKILHAAETSKWQTTVIGTPLYMAPEQIVADRIDARTDIYSLGITLYEMLNGTPPFYKGNVEYHHVHTPAEPLPDSIAPLLRNIVAKCIQKSPDERFQSVKEIFELARDGLS
jgi:molecular chaperone DnaK